jgi:hypothetical protein
MGQRTMSPPGRQETCKSQEIKPPRPVHAAGPGKPGAPPYRVPHVVCGQIRKAGLHGSSAIEGRHIHAFRT